MSKRTTENVMMNSYAANEGNNWNIGGDIAINAECDIDGPTGKVDIANVAGMAPHNDVTINFPDGLAIGSGNVQLTIKHVEHDITINGTITGAGGTIIFEPNARVQFKEIQGPVTLKIQGNERAIYQIPDGQIYQNCTLSAGNDAAHITLTQNGVDKIIFSLLPPNEAHHELGGGDGGGLDGSDGSVLGNSGAYVNESGSELLGKEEDPGVE